MESTANITNNPEDFKIKDGTLWEYKGKDPIVYVPDGVTRCEYGFRFNNSIEEIIFPDGFTFLASRSIRCCNNLIRVSFPDNVGFEFESFSECAKLSTIVFRGKNYTPPKIGDSFSSIAYRCKELKRIETTEEGMLQLYQALPPKAKYFSFDGKPILTPEQKEAEAAKSAVKKASKNAEKSSTADLELLDKIDKKAPEIRIPDGVKVIPSKYFSGLKDLKHLILGKDVTTIEANAFSGCEKLLTVLVNQGIASIAKSAFIGCYPYVAGPKDAIEIAQPAMKNATCFVIPEPSTEYEKQTFAAIYDVIPKAFRWESLKYKPYVPEIKYADGSPAPSIFALYIGYAYNRDIVCYDSDQVDQYLPEKNALADEIASKLDHNSLMAAMETVLPQISSPNSKVLFKNKDDVKAAVEDAISYAYDYSLFDGAINIRHGKGNIAYCRFADESAVNELIEMFESWDSLFDDLELDKKNAKIIKEFKKSGETTIKLYQKALLLNDTSVAKAYLEKKGLLDQRGLSDDGTISFDL